MRFIYAEYSMYNNSVDVTTFYGYILRVDCNVAEEGLRTTPCSQGGRPGFYGCHRLYVQGPGKAQA